MAVSGEGHWKASCSGLGRPGIAKDEDPGQHVSHYATVDSSESETGGVCCVLFAGSSPIGQRCAVLNN